MAADEGYCQITERDARMHDTVHWRHGYLGMTNSWARSLCSASSRLCCRCRKWCRSVDSRVGASAERRGSNGGRLVAGSCAAKMPTFSDQLRASCRAIVLLSNRFMGLPLLDCTVDRCSFFVTG